MSKLLKSKFLLGALVVTVMFVGALAVSPAKASADCSITVTLRQGSSGAEVMCLQTSLGGLTVDGSFGPKTKAAVVAWQAKSGLVADGIFGPLSRALWMANAGNSMNFPSGCTSAVGYSTTTGLPCFGGVSLPAGCATASGYSVTTGLPCSSSVSLPAGCSSASGYSVTTGLPCSGGVNLPAGCTSTAGYSPTTGVACNSGGSSSGGPLVGGAGSLDDVQELSNLSDEEVAEGDSDAKVAGWTFTADNGSDLSMTAFRLTFELTAGAGSDKLDDYADTVTVWQGSTEVGSADVDSFSENSGVYSKTLNLSNAVIRADQDSDFFIAVDALSNIDSSDLGANTWTLILDNVRFQDATGAIITDSSTGDIGGAGVDFSFESVATATGTELKVSTTTGASGDAVNDGHVVQVDDTSDTNDVPLLAFDLEATGDIQNIQDIPVTALSAGTGTLVDIVSGFTLWMDGTQIDAVNFGDLTTTLGGSTACTTEDTCFIHFDDVDFDMDDGDESNFVVKGDINDTSGTFVNGDNLTLTMPSANVDAIDAEDSNGDSVIAADLTGTATADTIAFYTDGIMLELVSVDESKVGEDAAPDTGTFVIKFTAEAFGQDIYVEEVCAQAGADGFDFDTNDGAGGTVTSCSVTSTADTDPTFSNFFLEEGTPETFTLTVVAAGDDTFWRVGLIGVDWALTDIADPAEVYDFNLEDFETDDIFLSST